MDRSRRGGAGLIDRKERDVRVGGDIKVFMYRVYQN